MHEKAGQLVSAYIDSQICQMKAEDGDWLEPDEEDGDGNLYKGQETVDPLPRVSNISWRSATIVIVNSRADTIATPERPLRPHHTNASPSPILLLHHIRQTQTPAVCQ